MTRSPQHEHEMMRRKLWVDAWVATASSDNCVDVESCTMYANRALADFDEQFPLWIKL
jgi:hypothetical protein